MTTQLAGEPGGKVFMYSLLKITTLTDKIHLELLLNTEKNSYSVKCIRLTPKATYTASKCDYWHTVNSLQAGIDYMEKQLENQKKVIAEKLAIKEQKKAVKNPFQPGDILYASWGYDQTNVDFYQVVSITEKTVSFREICGDSTETGFMCGQTKPTPDSFKGETFTRKISADYNMNAYVPFDRHGLRKTDKTESHYYSYYA